MGVTKAMQRALYKPIQRQLERERRMSREVDAVFPS
jgi:hypothetical protein